MKTITKSLLLAAAPLAAIVAMPVVAMAQAAPAVGVANLNEAVEKSNAWVLAANQIKITYKAQIDAFEARSRVLNGEIQPLVTAFQTAQRAPNPNQAALQTQAQAIQTRQQSAQKELGGLYQPIGRAETYAQEQIAAKLDAALKAAMVKKKVGIVLQPQATISYQPALDITADIIAELNTSVPNVSITPPANWQPGGQGGAAPAAAPAAGTPTPPKPQPQGR
jgi:Skp family chaperone for outer membrane proteins